MPSLYIPGGMERVLTVKANYFADILGYEVYIILTDGKNKTPYYLLSSNVQIINLGIDFDELWNKPFLEKIFIYLKKQVIYKRKLRECLFSIKPDITVSMLRREINFINSIHDGSRKIGEIHINKDNFRDFKQEKSNSIKRIFSKWWMHQLIGNLRKLDKFIVLTHTDQEKWTELQNTVIIGNPLSFYPQKVSNQSSKRVIAVGRLVHEKGYDRLIEVWKKVAGKHPDWSLHIYGDGDKEYYQKLIDQLNIQDKCILEPATTHIEEKYIESSISVLSSRFEGFGMVIGEAMACGLPVIAFDCPWGPREIIQNNEDGYLIPDGDIEMFANKICYLIENEGIRKEMGRKARTNIQRFKIEEIARQWDELFNFLLTKQQKS